MKKNKPFRELFYCSLKKTLLIMRIAIFLLILGMLQANAIDAFSQKNNFSVKFSDTEVSKILDNIEEESDYYFLYNEKLLDIDRKVDVSVEDQSINVILNDLFAGTNIKYTIIDNKIILAPDFIPEEHPSQQQITISGTVSDTKGETLAGVNVLLKGTVTGSITDINGKYSIEAPNLSGILVFSFIGYKSQEIEISGRNSINVVLTEETTSLGEVVVTALGITRASRSIGYSASSVDMAETPALNNIGNNLLGKVSGMNVAPLATGPGGSSKIRIRGQSSFGGDNSPLIVVNGNPINNESSKTSKGADAGDGLLSINESDIESMTVLKGAAAAALYGYRAKDGAIIITTKSGIKGAGIGVEYNFNFQIENAIDYTDFQYEYGEGINGIRQQTVAEAASNGTWSFGEKMDGVPTIQFDGTMQPYSPFKDRVKLFYKPGASTSNAIALSGGNEKGSFRLSFKNTDATAIVENSDFHSKIANLGINYKLTPKLTIQSSINYSNEYNHNPVKISGASSINETAFSAANSIPEVVLRKYEQPDGTPYHYCRYTSKLNPFWLTNKQFENQTRDRIIATGTLRYDFTKDYYFQFGIGQDYFTRPYDYNIPTYTANLSAAPTGLFNGRYEKSMTTFREINLDFLAGAKHSFGDFEVGLMVGGNQMDQESDQIRTLATNFYVLGTYSIGNGVTLSPSSTYRHKKVNSLYGSADFSYRDYLYLSFTARNDWFSTLNPESNSYLYPSGSLSFIFSQLSGLKPSWLDYGKLRLAYAEVGGDTDPYQNSLPYSLNTSQFNGSGLATIATSVSPNANLKPLKVKEAEFGIELRTFDSRLNIDASVYNKNTVDEILNVDVSNASGYSQTKVNIGKLRNRGVEVVLTFVPIIGNISWESTLTGAYNVSKVIQLASGQTRYDVANTPATLGTLSHEVGMPLASLRVYDYKRDDQGRIIVSSGLPIQGNKITVGSAIPKWTGSWTNTFTYKGFNLFTQIDFKAGSKLISATNYNEIRFGLSKVSLLGREGGVVLDAVNADGSANETAVSSYNYFANFSDGYIGMINVYDASYVKLRTVSIGRDISQLVKNTFIKGLSVNLNCNNVLMIKKYLDNMDPEAVGEVSDNNSGMESYSLPTTRRFGISVNMKF